MESSKSGISRLFEAKSVQIFICALIMIAAMSIPAAPVQAQNTRGPGLLFWTMKKAEQCQVLIAWTGQEPSRMVSNAIFRLPNPKAFPRALDRFHGPNFSDFFGKSYASLSKKEKKQLWSLARKCHTPGAHMYGVITALDPSKDKRTEDTRQAMRESIASVNSPSFFAEIESQQNYARRAEIDEAQFKGKTFAYDDGKLFFENGLLKFYWPHTIENHFDGPCKNPRLVHAVMKRDRDFMVTKPVVAQIHRQYLTPAIRKECGASSPAQINLEVHIEGVFHDYNGEEVSKSVIRAGRFDGFLAAANLILNENYSDPNVIDLTYGANPRVSSRGAYLYDNYYPFLASANASQAYVNRGFRTPNELVEADKRAQYALANPPWPEKPDAQGQYIEKSNFKGMSLDNDSGSLRFATFYFDAYSSQCAAQYKGAKKELKALFNRRNGQTTTYSPIGRTGLLQTRQNWEQERGTFATLRANQYAYVPKIIDIIGGTMWSGYRAFQGNGPIAKLQSAKVKALGCETSAMRAYERKLFAYIDKVGDLVKARNEALRRR